MENFLIVSLLKSGGNDLEVFVNHFGDQAAIQYRSG